MLFRSEKKALDIHYFSPIDLPDRNEAGDDPRHSLILLFPVIGSRRPPTRTIGSEVHVPKSDISVKLLNFLISISGRCLNASRENKAYRNSVCLCISGVLASKYRYLHGIGGRVAISLNWCLPTVFPLKLSACRKRANGHRGNGYDPPRPAEPARAGVSLCDLEHELDFDRHAEGHAGDPEDDPA